MAEDRDPNAPPQLPASTARLLQNVLKDPNGDKKFLRLLKEFNKDVAIPAVDLEDQIVAVREELGKENKELKNTVHTLSVERRIERERAALLGKGFTQADVDAIEARMQINPDDPDKTKADQWLPSNYVSAAHTYKMERQLAAPTPQIRQRTAAPVKDVISKEAMDAIASGDNSVLNAETRKLAHEHVDQLQQQRSVAGR